MSAILMGVLALIYPALREIPRVDGIFAGLNACVLAIVAAAALQLGWRMTRWVDFLTAGLVSYSLMNKPTPATARRLATMVAPRPRAGSSAVAEERPGPTPREALLGMGVLIGFNQFFDGARQYRQRCIQLMRHAGR